VSIMASARDLKASSAISRTFSRSRVDRASRSVLIILSQHLTNAKTISTSRADLFVVNRWR
jgi:hypothetical protein